MVKINNLNEGSNEHSNFTQGNGVQVEVRTQNCQRIIPGTSDVDNPHF